MIWFFTWIHEIRSNTRWHPLVRLTPSLPESICNVVLTLGPWTKSYGLTIQIKPLEQYFCMVPFVFHYFTSWNLGFFFKTLIFGTHGSKGLIYWNCMKKRDLVLVHWVRDWKATRPASQRFMLASKIKARKIKFNSVKTSGTKHHPQTQRLEQESIITICTTGAGGYIV